MTGCLVTVHKTGRYPFDTQLGLFLEEYDLSSEELQDMFLAFSNHNIYILGIGSTKPVAVALSDGQPRFLFLQAE